uniref:Variant surface glycoprotein n=1 Tax=Trypanosoma brucei TaxID=5691 RepID=A0A1V0FZY6_9TRYP|nr:variant surface glycoprotein [Trypanosoma brucei]
MNQQAVLLKTLVATVTRAHAALTREKIEDLQLLCDVFRLKDVDPQIPDIPDLNNTEITNIKAMNMTAADDKWQKLFAGDPQTDNLERRKQTTKKEPFQTHWEHNFRNWQEIYQQAYKKNTWQGMDRRKRAATKRMAEGPSRSSPKQDATQKKANSNRLHHCQN